MDPKTSRKVFELAKEQQDELSMPDDADDEPAPRTISTSLSRPRHAQDSDEDEEDEDLDYNGVADIEYEEEFVSATGVSVLCKT